MELSGGDNYTLDYSQVPIAQQAPAEETEESAESKTNEIEKSRKAQLKSLLLNSISPAQCESVESLTVLIENPDHKRVMIVANLVDRVANALLKKYATDQHIFYIDTAQLLSVKKETVRIDQDGNPLIETKTPIEKFLDEKSPHKIVMIDIRKTNLTAQQLTALNTCFDDKKRTINGAAIPDNITVVALTDQLPTDASLLSRQDVVVRMREIPCEAIQLTEDCRCHEIDLRGYPDWKKALVLL